ncbi:MAG TPA: polyprenyl synthetase family protein [Tissierellia bacterium]|nr:polyprenyl synthetase family protein [Tissierellia bacterium]
MQYDEEIKYLKDIIDNELNNIFKGKTGYQDRIFESMKYSLLAGGKRIRPILMLKTFQIFDDDYLRFMPYALAIEMIHTYSLIHDDLPAMDDDDFRRGRLTNHKVYGEAIAILSGDGLLNYAFETMSDFALKNSITIEDYRRNIWAIREISNYSGVFGMIGGQVVDLLSNEINMDNNKLRFMYECKTSALIQASTVSGAILGGGSDEDVERMRNFGLYLGLAYQIRDDLLDIDKDKEINKVTYLTFNDIEEAKEEIKSLSNKAVEILDYYDESKVKFLKNLTNGLINRNY